VDGPSGFYPGYRIEDIQEFQILFANGDLSGDIQEGTEHFSYLMLFGIFLIELCSAFFLLVRNPGYFIHLICNNPHHNYSVDQ